jgi:hypothetical protein
MEKISYYEDRIKPLFNEADIKVKDPISTVLTKFDTLKSSLRKEEFVALKAYLKDNWNIERNLLEEVLKPFQDPILTKDIEEDTNYIEYDDMIYNKCPECSGRLFPQFSFCPYCGYNTNLRQEEAAEPGIGRRRLKQKFKPRGFRQQGPRDGSGPNRFCPEKVFSDMIVESVNIEMEETDLGKISEMDIKNVERELERFIPQ